MLKSRKHVFWEALIVTIVIFLIGLFLGMLVETGNSNKMSIIYLKSEINLVDGIAVSLLSEDYGIDCLSIKEENINFANRVYEEARILEEYEEVKTLSQATKFLHKKYDLLRTLLWMSNQDSLKRCNNYNLLVYLYDYESEDNNIKAVQNVWSKYLFDLKKENENLLLLPIAANQNITSLNLLMNEYNITSLPALVINNKEVIYKIEDLKNIESRLNNVY